MRQINIPSCMHYTAVGKGGGMWVEIGGERMGQERRREKEEERGGKAKRLVRPGYVCMGGPTMDKIVTVYTVSYCTQMHCNLNILTLRSGPNTGILQYTFCTALLPCTTIHCTEMLCYVCCSVQCSAFYYSTVLCSSV